MKQLFRPKYEVEEILRNLEPVLRSGWTGEGPKCKEFEVAFSAFIGKKHGLYLNSCTAALHLALHCLDLPIGSIVGTTALTFVSTNAAIRYAGHTPYFVDVNAQDGALDAAAMMDAIENHGVSCVLWVHYGGDASPEFFRFLELRKAYQDKTGLKILVVEDCAHAAGGFYPGLETTVGAPDTVSTKMRRIGSHADTISCFSFQAVKNLPTADSGMLLSNDETLMARARRLSWLGIDKSTHDRTVSAGKELYRWRYDVEELGWKYKGNDVMATIGLTQLPYLDRDNAYRRSLQSAYALRLGSEASRPYRMLDVTGYGSAHLCALVVPKTSRDAVMGELRLRGYAPGVHYLANNLFPAFRESLGSTPVAWDLSDRLISLPCHAEMTYDNLNEVCDIVEDMAK